VQDDDRGRIGLYPGTARRDMPAGAAAVGPYAEEWMVTLTLATWAGLPAGKAAGPSEGGHR
jgi:hypothetical protein